jgi:hypothetical protein
VALDDALAAATLPAESRPARTRTAIGRALDRAALGAMRLAFDRAIAPNFAADVLRASAAPYVSDELVREPRRFFAFLDALGDREPLASTFHRRLPRGRVVAHAFASAYPRWHHDRGDPDADCVANDTIPVHRWMHDEQPRPTVIALHGFTMGRPSVDARVLMAARWFAAGLDVVMITLPFHGARAPATARFSGELFGSWHVGRLNEAVRQSIHDVGVVARWLRRDGARPLGIMGLSLGGYVAALAAELIDDWDFVMPVAPAVCLGSLPWRLFVESRHGRAGGLPFSLAELRAAYAVHSPLRRPLRVPRERVLVVAGRGDCIAPPQHAHALWRHWGEPAMHWFSGGHVAPFRRGAIVEVGLRHLAALGILRVPTDIPA